MVNVASYEEAVQMRRKYARRISKEEMKADAKRSAVLWHKMYFGIEPRSILQNLIYQLKLKRALGRRKHEVRSVAEAPALTD
jgi:hypothetical protein